MVGRAMRGGVGAVAATCRSRPAAKLPVGNYRVGWKAYVVVIEYIDCGTSALFDAHLQTQAG